MWFFKHRKKTNKINPLTTTPFPPGLWNTIPVRRWKKFQPFPESFQYLKEDERDHVRTCHECRALFRLWHICIRSLHKPWFLLPELLKPHRYSLCINLSSLLFSSKWHTFREKRYGSGQNKSNTYHTHWRVLFSGGKTNSFPWITSPSGKHCISQTLLPTRAYFDIW